MNTTVTAASILHSLSQDVHGCSNIFLDLGANIGVHSRFLFEPRKYPNSKFKVLFDRAFGKERKNPRTCAIGFEPNPVHTARHRALQAAYASMGWRYYFFPAGVGAQNGILSFYLNSDNANHEYWGFSTTKMRNRLDGKPELKQQEIKVPTVDLHAVLRTIQQRSMVRSAGRPAIIFIKMDIEGSEFEVLLHLMMQGTLCTTVDYLFTEFHAGFANFHPHTLRSSSNHTLTPEEANTLASTLEGVIADGSRRGCTVKWVAPKGEHEEYLHDGKPFPDPSCCKTTCPHAPGRCPRTP